MISARYAKEVEDNVDKMDKCRGLKKNQTYRIHFMQRKTKHMMKKRNLDQYCTPWP